MKVVLVCFLDESPPDIGEYIPPETTEIILVCVQGRQTKAFAAAEGIAVTEFPSGKRCRLGACSKRIAAAVESADMVLVFWDGKDRRTKRAIGICREKGIPTRVFV